MNFLFKISDYIVGLLALVCIYAKFQIKFDFAYTMRVGEKIVCTAQSTHCFIENNRPVALSKRLPELYKAIQEAYEAK